jgi:hypothetical protein
MVGVIGDDRCVILSMHNRGSTAPDDQGNRSAGSLHSRLLVGALLLMSLIPVTSVVPDFPEARQRRFPARYLKPTNRTAEVLPSRRHERVIDSHYKTHPGYHRRLRSAKGLQPFDWPQATAQGCVRYVVQMPFWLQVALTGRRFPAPFASLLLARRLIESGCSRVGLSLIAKFSQSPCGAAARSPRFSGRAGN